MRVVWSPAGFPAKIWDVSNALIVCDKCGKGVRVKSKKLEDGKRVRVCIKCGEVLDRV